MSRKSSREDWRNSNETISKNREGIIVYKEIYIYNDKKQLIQKISIKCIDSLTFKFLYKYDEIGKMIEETTICAYNERNSIDRKAIHYFNKKNNH